MTTPNNSNRDGSRGAPNPHPKHSDAWTAWRQLRVLEQLVRDGHLPATHSSWDAYWASFFADFSWDGRAPLQIRTLLEDDAFFPLAVRFQQRLGFRLRPEFDRALRQRLGQNSRLMPAADALEPLCRYLVQYRGADSTVDVSIAAWTTEQRVYVHEEPAQRRAERQRRVLGGGGAQWDVRVVCLNSVPTVCS